MSITGKRYKIRGKEFLWGDNYWNENGKIWFVSCKLNIIFFIDEKTSVITPVAKIPFRSRICFRLHPRCIKYGEKIFCIPDMGEDIYIYNLKQNSWKKIIICNTNLKYAEVTVTPFTLPQMLHKNGYTLICITI